MNIVAIHKLGNEKENLAGPLAEALNVSPYDALMRLRIAGNGPLTVAVFAQKEHAVHLTGKLQEAGFAAFFLNSNEIDSEAFPFLVRRFDLGANELRVENDKGDFLVFLLQNVDLILCGMRITRFTSRETVKERTVSPGRAVLSGGLMITKTTKTTRETITDERERFISVYAEKTPTKVFRENALDYTSLGSVRKHSRSENFSYLMAEMKKCCPTAIFDNRLMNRAAQAALLGPLLDPETNLAVSTALLAKSLLMME